MIPRQEPRIIHFNDCANVAKTLVEAARGTGRQWDYLPPAYVRPSAGYRRGPIALGAQLPYKVRHFRALATHDVVHVHYATAVSLLQKLYYPKRPYLLHLHGTDIRSQWLDPAYRSQIQAAIDGASAVYYTTPDLHENATKARPDASYMPAPVAFHRLPMWAPGGGIRPKIVFASRWDDSKGLVHQLETARELARAVGKRADILGLDWGPGAPAATALGVKLMPKMSHDAYLRYLASADVVIGQATGALGLSELEAMAIGAVVACPGEQRRVDDDRPPVLEGSVKDVVEQVLHALKDCRAESDRLGSMDWTKRHHSAQTLLPLLDAAYYTAARAERR